MSYLKEHQNLIQIQDNLTSDKEEGKNQLKRIMIMLIKMQKQIK